MRQFIKFEQEGKTVALIAKDSVADIDNHVASQTGYGMTIHTMPGNMVSFVPKGVDNEVVLNDIQSFREGTLVVDCESVAFLS